MKCPSCGNDLHIEDEKCPYCGKENPYYKKHRLAMKKYQKEFNDVKEDVYRKTGRLTSLQVKALAIAILLLLNMGLMILGKNAWGIHYYFEKIYVDKHNEEYLAVMEQLESEKDYFALGCYYGTVFRYGSYDNEYYRICRMSHFYSQVYAEIMDLKNENGWNTMEGKIKYLCEDIEYMYECSVQDDYDDPMYFGERHRAAMEDIKEEVKGLLITYANLTEEEAELFATYSNGQKQLVLEKAVAGNEE